MTKACTFSGEKELREFFQLEGFNSSNGFFAPENKKEEYELCPVCEGEGCPSCFFMGGTPKEVVYG